MNRQLAETWNNFGLTAWFALFLTFIACRACHLFVLPWPIVLAPLWVPWAIPVARVVLALLELILSALLCCLVSLRT